MREYALTLAVVAGVTYLLTPLARRLAIRLGALAKVRDRDVHSIPTPYGGGVAMYVGIAAGLVVASRLPALQSVFELSREPQAVLQAGALLVVLGTVDDRWPLDALTKLAGQILAAGVLVLGGVQLLYLPDPRGGNNFISLGPDLGVPLTVLIVVLTINAVNFIDGLDGLAAGVVGIAALSFFVYSYNLSVVYGFVRAVPPTLIAAILVGACAGFLPHNFNPARIFMGDAGSMLLGLLLAAATVSVTGQIDPSAITGLDVFPVLLPLLLPVAVLAVPLVDLLLAVVRRTRHGRSPFAPDKLHLHHRLLEIGHSQTRAVLIMYLWSGLLAFTAVALSMASGPLPVLGVAGVVAIVAAIASSVPRLRPARR
ncbi:MAG: undecaprenyl/decaprenyl-phosphate alpha-N-acetylglucosaminyl 1-phosphate transferase [Actinomycetota bacterium]|nr:undecaprenyl/decaprenyl-phosphate alpha-N-acetylglucosaminyl 1-phosphate transferase [Actinomycetota bacterium]